MEAEGKSGYASHGVSRDVDVARTRLCPSRNRHSARTEARPPGVSHGGPREVEALLGSAFREQSDKDRGPSGPVPLRVRHLGRKMHGPARENLLLSDLAARSTERPAPVLRGPSLQSRAC